MSRPYAVREEGMLPRLARGARMGHPVGAVFTDARSEDGGRSARSTHTRPADRVIRCTVPFTSRSRMPIPTPVKAVLRKDLLLGGAAGTALCAALVGAAITIGPLLGIDWGSGSTAGGGAPESASLPALPRVANPSAEALRARTRAPRIVDTASQPTTRVAPRPAARPAPAPAAATPPSIAGRRPQATSTPPVTPGSDSTGAPDFPAVPAPAPAAPVAAAAAAIPATPVLPAAVAAKMKLRVASLAVEPNDNGTPQLRLGLSIDPPRAPGGGGASSPPPGPPPGRRPRPRRSPSRCARSCRATRPPPARSRCAPSSTS